LRRCHGSRLCARWRGGGGRARRSARRLSRGECCRLVVASGNKHTSHGRAAPLDRRDACVGNLQRNRLEGCKKHVAVCLGHQRGADARGRDVGDLVTADDTCCRNRCCYGHLDTQWVKPSQRARTRAKAGEHVLLVSFTASSFALRRGEVLDRLLVVDKKRSSECAVGGRTPDEAGWRALELKGKVTKHVLVEDSIEQRHVGFTLGRVRSSNHRL